VCAGRSVVVPSCPRSFPWSSCRHAADSSCRSPDGLLRPGYPRSPVGSGPSPAAHRRRTDRAPTETSQGRCCLGCHPPGSTSHLSSDSLCRRGTATRAEEGLRNQIQQVVAAHGKIECCHHYQSPPSHSRFQLVRLSAQLSCGPLQLAAMSLGRHVPDRCRAALSVPPSAGSHLAARSNSNICQVIL
jgi:hypothetical protein